MPPTHEVFNQVPPLTGYDVADDPAMLDALRREGAGWAEPDVRSIGRRAGTQQAQDWGRLPTSTRRYCTRTTGTGSASMRWSSTRPGTS